MRPGLRPISTRGLNPTSSRNPEHTELKNERPDMNRFTTTSLICLLIATTANAQHSFQSPQDDNAHCNERSQRGERSRYSDEYTLNGDSRYDNSGQYSQPIRPTNSINSRQQRRNRPDYRDSQRSGDWNSDAYSLPAPESRWNRDYSGYRDQLQNAVQDSFRSPYEPRDDFEGRDQYQQRRPMADPFRLPEVNQSDRRYRNAPLSRNSNEFESRQRIPYSPVDYMRPTDRGDYRDSLQRQNRGQFDLRNSGRSQNFDPLTPPLPRRESGNEIDAIRNAITLRYSNPVSVRAALAMSSNQGLQLYREVNQQVDQRHLEPSSYDLRVRRGMRNLALALENPAFVQNVGIANDSFRLDSFRDSLMRMASSMQVGDSRAAEQAVQTVMQQAQNVPGLQPGLVAYEFANATIDTLDKFSALEPKDPGRGASLDLVTEETRKAALESEIVGVGVEIKLHEQGLLIMKALRGGPAAEAGLQSGDIITAIDGRSIGGMQMARSVDLMQGNSGSRIQLSIVRNSSRPANVSLVRRRVRVYTVNDLKMIPQTQNVAYVSLSQFGQKSTEELDQALSQLYQSGMKSLILDLRGNPGGLLDVCVDITNRFLPCGTIVSTRGRLPADNMKEDATYSRTWNTPLVVLIDKDSASASEIFAAAVQDNERGIVVGTKSYGKGTVQTHFPLSTVTGNLRLTTARFYSPNGRAMSGSGVTPDVRIEDADGPANGDQVLEQAIQIAQSQRLKDIAQASRSCRPRSGKVEAPTKNATRPSTNDAVPAKTVLR